MCVMLVSKQKYTNYSIKVLLVYLLFPLELVYSDVWGPTCTSVGGYKYYVSFLDDFSKFTWVYFLKHKSDVEQTFLHFQQHVERLLNTKI